MVIVHIVITGTHSLFMLDILLCIVESSHTALPLSGGRRVGWSSTGRGGCRAIPGWTEEVEPSEESHFIGTGVGLLREDPAMDGYMIQW